MCAGVLPLQCQQQELIVPRAELGPIFSSLLVAKTPFAVLAYDGEPFTYPSGDQLVVPPDHVVITCCLNRLPLDPQLDQVLEAARQSDRDVGLCCLQHEGEEK